MHLAIDRQPGAGTTARLVVCGELDITTTPELRDALRAERAAGHDLTLDLSLVGFIDSTGLRTVMLAARAAEAEGWSFTVGGELQRPVERAMALSGVLPLLSRTA